MLSADDNLSNNAVSDTFKLLTFDAAVSGITIPDSLPAGNCILVAEVTNYSRIPGALWVDCRVLSGDTLPVYVQSESIYITTVSMQWVTLPTWNATPGHYVAKVFAVHNGRVMRDTLRAAFVVFPTGIEQPMEAPPGVWGHRTTATIVRGALTVPFTAYRLPLAACLLDISGCKVLDLKPGANDIRDLAPGVYFVQLPPAANGKRPAITKIIVTE
jgi:hypothetical protein